MKHPSCRDLFAYWNEQRDGRPAPDRAEIEPGAIRHLLGDTFILAPEAADQYTFRLAGTRVCALFCRELRRQDFHTLWREGERLAIRELLAAVTDEKVGVVASVTGRTSERSPLAVKLELLLLPLGDWRAHEPRVLGLLAPMAVPYWIGVKPVRALELGSIRHVGSALDLADGPQLAPATLAGRPYHGLVVYDGGRVD
jgi:hypothetical protein